MRHVNLEDPHSSDKLAWAAAAAGVAVIVSTLLLPRGANQYVRLAGVVTLFLGAMFAFVPFVQLRRFGRAGDQQTYMETEVVADRGLYAVIRHPQYLGYMLMTGGFALLAHHWLPAVLAVATAVLFYLQAVREEVQCLERLGEPYEEYCRRVPRFNVFLGVARWARRS